MLSCPCLPSPCTVCDNELGGTKLGYNFLANETLYGGTVVICSSLSHWLLHGIVYGSDHELFICQVSWEGAHYVKGPNSKRLVEHDQQVEFWGCLDLLVLFASLALLQDLLDVFFHMGPPALAFQDFQ